MRVLAIEDNDGKATALNALVAEIDPDATFARCGDIRSAFLELEATVYDLIVLDLMMPLTVDGEPQDTGKEILHVISTSKRNHSTAVVALTQYTELYERQEHSFAQLGVILVHFDFGSLDWRKTIGSLLRRVSEHPRCEFAIICALELEREALRATRASIGAKKRENGLDVMEIDIGRHRGKAILLPRPGIMDACVVTASVVERYRPRLIGMTGICAGVEGRVELGQVLACEICWEYQVGKFTPEGFQIEPYQTTVSEEIRQRLLGLCRSERITDLIYRQMVPEDIARCGPSLGTIVSGSAVIADGNVREFIRTQHRKIDAIEMELAGVFRAVNLVDDGVVVVGVKAVADFADHKKSDKVQEFAATASAHFSVEAIEDILDGV